MTISPSERAWPSNKPVQPPWAAEPNGKQEPARSGPRGRAPALGGLIYYRRSTMSIAVESAPAR